MTSRIKLAIAAFGSTLVYLGLTIVAAGGIRVFFSHPARIALVIVLVLATGASLLTQGNLSSGEREDRGNRWVLPVFGVLGVLQAVVPASTDRIDFWTIDGDTTRWIGVGLFAAGCAIRLWPVFVLGRRFSGLVAIQPGHTLVTDGIYGVIRHPSYLGLLISSLGWVLIFRSTLGLVIVLLTLIPIIGRIHAEENLLHSQFGEAYDAYRARTSRLIPGVY